MMAALDFGTGALVFSVFGLVLCRLARGIAGWPRRLCAAILYASMAADIADMMVRTAAQYQVCIPIYRALLVVQSLTAPIPTLLLFAYILHCCEEDYGRNALFRVLCILSGVMAVGASIMETVGEIGPAPDYELRMGWWPVLFFAFSVALMTVTLIALFRRWKKLTNAQRIMFLLSSLTSRSSAIIFVEFLLVYDLIRRYLVKQEESEQQRTRLAVAQMHPHFIYNTLMSLYYLCVKDPEKTQRVIRDFTRYLQNNFTAIAEVEAIPFTKELEHTRAYLAVEQACNEGRLFVEFDTPVTFFRVPALTLQPIVENAVKHGLSPELESLSISVLTEETDGGVKITVVDTGPGYHPAEDDEPHIALANIKERLRVLCGGTLTIAPREGGGTEVTILIPLQKTK